LFRLRDVPDNVKSVADDWVGTLVLRVEVLPEFQPLLFGSIYIIGLSALDERFARLSS
jgi:hypothetical protein